MGSIMLKRASQVVPEIIIVAMCVVTLTPVVSGRILDYVCRTLGLYCEELVVNLFVVGFLTIAFFFIFSCSHLLYFLLGKKALSVEEVTARLVVKLFIVSVGAVAILFSFGLFFYFGLDVELLNKSLNQKFCPASAV